jgi:hypothetical protein
MPDPAAVDEHWRRICQQMTMDTAAAEHERGRAEGYALCVSDLKAWQQGVVRDARLEARRWHLCCPACRAAGHQDGCERCEDRTRATFAGPMNGDAGPPGEAV